MQSRFQLESFELATKTSPPVITPAELDEARLSSFDKGFRAGWDDCTATREAEEAELRIAIGQHLQQVAFSYHEARQGILESLRPLLLDIVEKILPLAAQVALPGIVMEIVEPAAQQLTDQPIVIRINPESRKIIEEFLLSRTETPFEIISDTSLSKAQIDMKLNGEESRIDLDRIVMNISEAIMRYFNARQEEVSNG